MDEREPSRRVISRKEAMASNLIRYFTGKACKRGHFSSRLVSTCQCCECLVVRLRQQRQADPEKYRGWDRRQKDKDREKLRVRDKKRYWANPDRARIRGRNYYEANADGRKRYARQRTETRRRSADPQYVAELAIARERVRKWLADNPDRAVVQRRNQKARRKKALGTHTADDIKAIFKVQYGKCAYCRIELCVQYHVDHIVPLARGGSNDRQNLQLLCRPCNLAKGARDPIEYARFLGLLL